MKNLIKETILALTIVLAPRRLRKALPEQGRVDGATPRPTKRREHNFVGIASMSRLYEPSAPAPKNQTLVEICKELPELIELRNQGRRHWLALLNEYCQLLDKKNRKKTK